MRKKSAGRGPRMRPKNARKLFINMTMHYYYLCIGASDLPMIQRSDFVNYYLLSKLIFFVSNNNNNNKYLRESALEY